MADQTLTQEDIEARALEIANQRLAEEKNKIVELVTGKQSRYGDDGPKDWDAFHNTVKEDAVNEAVSLAEKRILSKIESEKKAEEDKVKQAEQEKAKQVDLEWSIMTSEWREAVSDGLLPAISPELDKKLQGGAKFADLTADEQKDPGLLAYNEALRLHADARKKGESYSLYRTVLKNKDKQPAGAGAPVFGGAVASQPEGDGYTYDQLHAEAKQTYRSRFR